MKNHFIYFKAGLLFFFIVAVFWGVSIYSRSVGVERSFSVSGEGKAVAVPDVAELSFGVLTEGGKNLTDLQKQNTEKMNRVIGFLKEEGIDDKDIKTRYYNISPRYQYFSCPPVPLGSEVSSVCPPSEITGYSISQDVLVKVRDLNKTGEVLSGVVSSGTNTVSGPTFTIDDPDELENQARSEAIKEAKEKAKSIAKAGKFKLGKLISIQEGFSPYYPIAFEGRGGAGSAPSIEPGSQEIVVNVTLIYEIK